MCHAHLKSPSDFRAHFEDVHRIGKPRLNCVFRKRKSEEDEEQDTKGEALLCEADLSFLIRCMVMTTHPRGFGALHSIMTGGITDISL